MPSRCCREDRSGGWCLFEALYILSLLRGPSPAIAALQSRPLSGIRTVATGDLADAL